MIRGLVVFDCDGVLVDSEPVANAVLAEMVTELGLPMTTQESMRVFMGRTLTACVEILAERLGRRPPEDFIPELERRVLEAFERDLSPVEGIEAALDAVASMRLATCVASNGSVAKMERTLGRTGLLPRFEGRLFSSREVARGKPHPDVFLHAARSMGAPPRACVVVEDSVLGVEGAVAAEMTVLGFARDTIPDALRGAGARVFEDMSELPQLIRETFAAKRVA